MHDLKIDIKKIEALVSRWSINAQSLLEISVFPPGQRPWKLVVLPCKNIVMFGLRKVESSERVEAIQKILEAS